MNNLKKFFSGLILATLLLAGNLNAFAQYASPTQPTDPGPVPSGPSSGSTNINVAAGGTVEVSNPLAGVSNIKFNFSQAVTGGSISYRTIPTSSLTNTSFSGFTLNAIQYTYTGVSSSNTTLDTVFTLNSSYVNRYGEIVLYGIINGQLTRLSVRNMGTNAQGQVMFAYNGPAYDQFALVGVNPLATPRTGGVFSMTNILIGFAILTLLAIGFKFFDKRDTNKPSIVR